VAAVEAIINLMPSPLRAAELPRARMAKKS
jgi:hypothetical protein